MTVVLNDNNELIPSRTVTGRRVCIDYRKLNDATRKDHFPLPFIDQMLERLCGNEYYCFLGGFLGFFQISIAPEDQENTTFTCPYGTFAYRRMPFGLWAENLAADHLSRLENPDLRTFVEKEITNEFPDEHLMILKAKLNNDESCASITERKVYESRLYWPSIFKAAKDYVMKCDACQRSGNISSRSEMP
ncbi:reverse transcriptase domain-containing protein [Tanacetum coccineum]